MRVLYNSRHPDYMRTRLKDSIRDEIAESDSGLRSDSILAKLNMREPFGKTDTDVTELSLTVHTCCLYCFAFLVLCCSA
jgi:hypothetical protein